MALCASPAAVEPLESSSSTAVFPAVASEAVGPLTRQPSVGPLTRQSSSSGANANGIASAVAADARGRRARKKRGEEASDDADNGDEAADVAAPQKRARGGSTSSTAQAQPQVQVDASLINRYQGSLSHALSSMAQAERREQRERLRRDSRRLGNFRRGLYGRGQDRDAAVQWEGGTEEEEIESLKKRIDDQRRQVEEIKKSLQKPLKGRQRLGQTLEEVEEETWEQKELCHAKGDAAKRYELELADRTRRLAIERAEHLRLYRVIEEEDKLSFGSFQPLRKRYQLLRLLSRSSSTEVYKAHDLQQLCPCMVKIHSLGCDSQVGERAEHLGVISGECEAYKQLQCRSLAMLMDHFAVEEGSKYATIWEFCEGDSFEAYVCRHGPVPEKEARGVVLQLLSTLRNVESKGFPSKNLDLKPSRITLRGGEVKITSIGLNHLKSRHGVCRRRPTLEVPADDSPLESQVDCLDGTDSASSAVAITGAIMFELLFGRPPEAAASVDTGASFRPFSMGTQPVGVQFPESPRHTAECRDFLSRLLDRDRRLTVQQAYADPFVTGTKKQR